MVVSKEFCLVGLPRSGQHGVATWLMGNLPSPSLFVNNKTSIRPDNIWYIDGKRRQGNYKSISEFTCYGLEGQASLADMNDLPTVFVLRDIKNHMASLIKHRTLSVRWIDFFEYWKQYARLAVDGQREYPFLVIPFASWFTSRPFREDAFGFFKEMMDFEAVYNDDTRKDVMASGGGSSFDGQRFLGCGDKMKVLERYKSVELPPIPDDVLELNEQVFGCIYD
jgi:hypothetical protein